MTIKTMMTATAAIAFVAVSSVATAQSAPAPAAGSGPATPATSPAATPVLAAGATVYDPQGGTVGTVESLQGDFVVLATAKSKARLPKSSFATGAKGPVIAMTAAQLDQAAAQAAPTTGASAAATAKPDVTKGAQVADTQGGAVGTIAEVDAQFATVTLTTGGKVRLPVTAFGAGTNGTLRVAMTAAQLSAAAGAAGGSSGGSN